MKAALLTPLYLSLSWILTVSYQIFTVTAVSTISVSLDGRWPAGAAWLSANIQTVSFIYSFSWIFVLSSVLPALILGRERSVLVQYLVCLLLALLALSAQNLAPISAQVRSIMSASALLGEPVFALLYLVIPYAFMLSLDLRSKRRRSRDRRDALPGISPERGGVPSGFG